MAVVDMPINHGPSAIINVLVLRNEMIIYGSVPSQKDL